MVVNVQLGKTGITENFLEVIKNGFKHNKQVRISVLRSYTREKAKIKEAAENLSEKLTDNSRNIKFRIIGFTIILLRHKVNK